MPIRPGWYEDYWKRLDKSASAKMRTTCPRCGSAKTYFNQQYQAWRCGRCEHSFTVEGYGNRRSWWKRLFGRG
jgi:ribosomal protein S27AE